MSPRGTERLVFEALSPGTRSALELVAPLARRRGFYLVGGTAIALHLGHRRSVDLDWFRAEAFDPTALHAQLRSLRAGVDQVAAGPGVLYFSRLIQEAARSYLTRLVSTPIYRRMTIRNWNTTTRVLLLMEPPA